MNNLLIESIPIIFSSTDLWPFCITFGYFWNYFNFDQYLLSKTLHWKISDGFNLKSFFKKPLYRQNIIVPVREQRNHLLVLLSFLNKLITWGLFHPCFSNALLRPVPPCTFAFYHGMQDDSTWLHTMEKQTNIQNHAHCNFCLNLPSEEKISSSTATYAKHMDTTGRVWVCSPWTWELQLEQVKSTSLSSFP